MKKRFVLIYLVSIFFFAIPILFNLIVLKNAGEIDSIESIVQKQISEDTIYGSATNQNTFFYKLGLIKATKPDIVAIGSSRVMQFRKEMFTKSFSNAGGAVNSVAEAEKFVNEMLKFHKPKIVIFGLDDWWFNPNSAASNWKNPDQDTSSLITFQKVTAPYLWLYDKKITWKNYADLILSGRETTTSKLTNSQLLGISAIQKETGFRPDGSYFYGNMMTTTNQNDYMFRDTLRRINDGVDRFEYADTISNTNWIKIKSIIHHLETKGIKVVTFIPPYSNTAYTTMKKTSQYHYMEIISNHAKTEGIYDFRDPYTLNLTDCDFTDGFHGSEVAYLKLLLNIYEIEPFLNNTVVTPNFLRNIESKLNLPFQITNKYIETNFLGINCKRRSKGSYINANE
jgi:hypothetical protein